MLSLVSVQVYLVKIKGFKTPQKINKQTRQANQSINKVKICVSNEQQHKHFGKFEIWIRLCDVHEIFRRKRQILQVNDKQRGKQEEKKTLR